MRTFAIAVLLLFGAAAMPVAAQVTVSDAWVRATAPGQTVAGAYMKIKSSKTSTLVAVRTPVSKDAQLHEMSMDNGVMKMKPVARIELPAGKTVDLKPGGYHLMFMNIAKPLRKGDTVPITLVVEGPDKKQQQVEVKAEVRDMMANAGGPMQMDRAK